VPTETVDAVVIGAGPNGLVAANLLADAGWDVLVLEAADQPGGAVRTAELIEPGFRSDLFSAFYPLGAASPILRALRLEEHGLRWVHAPAVLAHVLPDDRCALLSRDLDRTATVTPGAPSSPAGRVSATNCCTRCSPRSRPSGPAPGWPGRSARPTVCGSRGC
jgi:phytoene dehydrogenase-like protein